MKTLLSITILFIIIGTQDASGQNLNKLRTSYNKAVTEESVCRELIKGLRSEPNKSAVRLAYLGALQTIWANHVFGPFSKLKTFNKGTQKIEKAINRNPESFEIRYLRLAVQKNAPGILGYNDAIEKDLSYLRNNIESISSNRLKKMVRELLEN